MKTLFHQLIDEGLAPREAASVVAEDRDIRKLEAEGLTRSDAQGTVAHRCYTTARFWVYANGGPVKITLAPGCSLSWSSGGACDEGYSYEQYRWENCRDSVTEEFYSSARDCDGRTEHSVEYECTRERLLLGNLPRPDAAPFWDGVRWPDWKIVDSCRRDHAAEAAGY